MKKTLLTACALGFLSTPSNAMSDAEKQSLSPMEKIMAMGGERRKDRRERMAEYFTPAQIEKFEEFKEKFKELKKDIMRFKEKYLTPAQMQECKDLRRQMRRTRMERIVLIAELAKNDASMNAAEKADLLGQIKGTFRKEKGIIDREVALLEEIAENMRGGGVSRDATSGRRDEDDDLSGAAASRRNAEVVEEIDVDED